MIYLNNIDNMKFSPQFEDNFFDLVDADPPYYSGPEKRGFYGNGKFSNTKVRRRNYDVTDSWELPDKIWFKEIKRVSKNQIIWGANYFDFIGKPFKTPRGEEIHKFIKENPKGWIIWDKCNGGSMFNDYELAWTSFDFPTTTYKFMWNGMNQGKSLNEGHIMQGNKKLNQIRIHPTEKPIMLYDWQFNKFTSPGQKVYSPFGGSFSDAISAMKFDFDFFACEINEKIFQKSVERYKTIKSQYKLKFI